MIALITPTGARPDQIRLCAEFMKKQTFTGDVLWILIDDADPETTHVINDNFRKGWTIERYFPYPKWKLGTNTQARNLTVGINAVKDLDVEAIFIIEDDDYYSPSYLEGMINAIKGYDVAGQLMTIYYDVVVKGWLRNGNRSHLSLFQIAFTKAMIPKFLRAMEMSNKFIDMNFCRLTIDEKRNFFNGKDLAIGIKGMPGRAGIGRGHRMDASYIADADYSVLRDLIGEDYLYYRNLKK